MYPFCWPHLVHLRWLAAPTLGARVLKGFLINAPLFLHTAYISRLHSLSTFLTTHIFFFFFNYQNPETLKDSHYENMSQDTPVKLLVLLTQIQHPLSYTYQSNLPFYPTHPPIPIKDDHHVYNNSGSFHYVLPQLRCMYTAFTPTHSFHLMPHSHKH